MNRNEIKDKVLEVLQRFTLRKLDTSKIEYYDKPAEILYLDSLEMAQFLDEVEREFNIRMDDDVFNRGKDLELRDIVEAVHYKLNK